MDNIISSIRNLFSTYGFKAGAIIVLTILIVNLLKKPIVRLADKVTKESGLDKSVITKYITALPVFVAFVLDFGVSLVLVSFDFTALDFGEIIANAVLYGALAIATYESVKKQLEAYASSKNDKTAEKVKSEQKNTTINFSANG